MTEHRYLGVTDECVTCQQCGRDELRSTVVLGILDADGNVEAVTYYGSSCAARVLGRTGRGSAAKVLAEARAAHSRTVALADDARRMLAHYGVGGDVTRAALDAAATKYAHAHRDAVWAAGKLHGDWVEMVKDMITRRSSYIREAELLGV